MDSDKKSNKIIEIVRLQQIMKKWKKLAISSKSTTSNVVPKGYLAVCVGEELKRFTIPTQYLSHSAFQMLLREAEEEFGFGQTGVLKIPCEVGVFESVLKLVQGKKDFLFIQDCRRLNNKNVASHPRSPMCR